MASQAYGRLPLAKLAAPAIALAEKGFAITAHEADGLNRLREAFIRLNTRPVAFVKDTPWKEGDTLVQKDLANTLRRIAKKGMKGFYAGETARLVAEEMQRGGGVITAADMAAYKAVTRKPVEFMFRGIPSSACPSPAAAASGCNRCSAWWMSYSWRNILSTPRSGATHDRSGAQGICGPGGVPG